MMIVNVIEASRNLGVAVPFNFSTSAEELDATHESYAFDGAIEVVGTITNTGRAYRLTGTISCTKSFDCDRCLEHAVQQQVHEFDEEFQRGAKPFEDSESQSTDVNYFEGESIDITALVRDTLLAAQPMSNICREDCQGLCLICGANLNHGDCGCDRFIPDPRLAALKDFFKGKED